MTKTYVRKLVLVGAGGVGKTSIATRLITSKFTEPKMTVGLNVESWTVEDESGVSVKVVSFDLGGQQQFRFFQQGLVSGAHLAVVVYDVTRYESFMELDGWLDMIRDVPAGKKILVANKADLGSIVPDEEGRRFAETNDMEFVVVSAKSGKGFEELERAIWKGLKAGVGAGH